MNEHRASDPQDWDHRSTPQAGAAGRSMHLPMGRVVGGSHALNATIWVRGHRQDFADWAEVCGDDWVWDSVLPYFERAEAMLPMTTEFDHNTFQLDAHRAIIDAGIPANPNYNSGENEGVGMMQLNVADGERCTTWNAHLEPVSDHPNLTLVTDARVTSLLLDGTTVTGAEITDRRATSAIEADATILCAGAFGTPEILLRSGIGPASHLAEVGVPVVVDRPGVGSNLQDHLLVPAIYSTDREVPAPTVAVTEVHWFAKSDPDQPIPDTQPMVFSLPMPSEDHPDGKMDVPENGFTLMAAIVRPRSRGTVRLSGAGIDDPLLIDSQALAEDADVAALVSSLEQVRAVGSTRTRSRSEASRGCASRTHPSCRSSRRGTRTHRRSCSPREPLTPC